MTTREDIKRARMELNFRQKHGDAGWEDLMRMINEGKSVQDIKSHFGLSKQRMSIILMGVLGKPYSIYLAEQEKDILRHKHNGGKDD